MKTIIGNKTCTFVQSFNFRVANKNNNKLDELLKLMISVRLALPLERQIARRYGLIKNESKVNFIVPKEKFLRRLINKMFPDL